MVNGDGGVANEYQIEFMNQWFNFHSHLLYAMEVYLVNENHNVSCCKSKCELLNWLSRQQSNQNGSLNIPYKLLWSLLTCHCPNARWQI
jgi:hypothetical protein